MDLSIGFPAATAIGVLALYLFANLVVWAIVQIDRRSRRVVEFATPREVEGQRTLLTPRTAAVKPRVRLPQIDDVIPLEEQIRDLLEEDARGAVLLTGGPGAGKTTSLEHLAAAFSDDARLCVLDDPDLRLLDSYAWRALVVYTTNSKELEDWQDLGKYKIAPWNRDDLIEYLLAVHPQACGSVMERLGSKNELDFQGCPEIWRVILDTLAADFEIPNARSALSRYLEWLEPDFDAFKATGRACLDRVTSQSREENPVLDPPSNEFERLLRHRDVQILIAAEQLADELQKPTPPEGELLVRFFPRRLVRETAAILMDDVGAMTHLLEFAEEELPSYSLIFSLAHAERLDWTPTFTTDPNLKFAYLDGIQWPGVNLKSANIEHADFRRANLTESLLDRIDARNAKLQKTLMQEASMYRGDFRQADLSGANCSDCSAEQTLFSHARLNGTVFARANLAKAVFTDAELKNADFEEAELSGVFLTSCDLEGASFVGANLAQAKLADANLDGADFTGANLEGSRLLAICLGGASFDGTNFRNADLRCCNLEDLHCRNVNFENANLKLALMTGSQFENAKFTNACLRGARLAEISWEGADLRGADLRGATFHMGSSRSGLLFTGIASEGTRTGFYTDDYEDQSFRSPEEIRKANLSGADLRGANLQNVDFYLVDLRGAMFDPDQADHLRRSGAILST